MSLQIKPKRLITQRSRNISFASLISAFNAGFFIAKIDKIKKWLTLQLLQFELVLMIFRAMSSQLALYKMSLVPTWILTASGLLSVSDSMI